MKHITIDQFRVVPNHPYLRALADIEINKMKLRGLRLEDRGRGELTLGFPGRKIQGQWQVVYETEDRRVHGELLECLVHHYQHHLGAAA